MRVVIASVTKQHAYPIALAADEYRYLDKFFTGLYYKPDKLRYRLLERAIRGVRGNGDLTRLHTRRQEGLSDDRVMSVFLPEFLEQIWRRSALLSHITDPDSITYLKNEVFDWLVARRLPPCDIFHGFEQCALFSLRKAKELGAARILDQPVVHRALWDRLEEQERRRVGLPAPKRPFWYAQHIHRKYRELEYADYLFVGLEFVRKSFVEAGFPSDRIFLIPYGADLSGTLRVVQRSRRKTFNILFVGQISWYKGLHYLLEAYDRLGVENVSLTVIGMVHPEWLPYFEERFRRVQNPLRYLGRVPRDELARHYEEADVFVFPSLGGGIGLAVYEAMAAGLPVITSDGDVVIRDGVDGLVVPAHETERWAETLLRLKENADLRQRLGASAAERVRSFSWDAYRTRVIQAYREIARREGIQVD
ncbi:MAG TPA: glycosyltransferase family 4 protein [Candidatus Acidoferrales bacterium]|nr:glycosyltransferase family 4 protein [Candidatus Acidoferrales bacterium]